MDQSSDPTIILIKNIFEIMLSSFSAGDAKGVAEHLEFPALGINSPTTAFNSKEEFIDFFNLCFGSICCYQFKLIIFFN